MASCKVCGCSNWFFWVSPQGLCRNCSNLASADIQQRSRIVREEARLAEQTLNPHSKIAHMDAVVENLKTLADYEKKGIGVPDKKAAERLRKSRTERDSLLLKTARSELDETLKRVRGEKDPAKKSELYSAFLLKLKEYRARLKDRKPVETLIRKVEGTIIRIRLNGYLEAARKAERSEDRPTARLRYQEALAYLKMKAPSDRSATGYRVKIEERIRDLGQ